MFFSPFGETGVFCGFGVFPIWHFAIDINSVNAPKCCNLGQAAISCTRKNGFHSPRCHSLGNEPTSDA